MPSQLPPGNSPRSPRARAPAPLRLASAGPTFLTEELRLGGGLVVGRAEPNTDFVFQHRESALPMSWARD